MPMVGASLAGMPASYKGGQGGKEEGGACQGGPCTVQRGSYTAGAHARLARFLPAQKG